METNIGAQTETTALPSGRQTYPEGKLTNMIEQQTAKLPSDLFLWAAGASVATSATLKLLNRDKDALFVGQWAPTFLLLGIYSKMAKLLGNQ